MIIMRNYFSLETYILLEPSGYSIVNKNEVQSVSQGVAGFSEDEQLVGIYVEDNKFYFYYNGKSFEATVDNFICTHQSLTSSSSDTCFRVTICGQTICEIVYEPYVTFEMILHGIDPEEFDFLIYLSRVLNSKESMESFIGGKEWENAWAGWKW
jgi:hypothetical protein